MNDPRNLPPPGVTIDQPAGRGLAVTFNPVWLWLVGGAVLLFSGVAIWLGPRHYHLLPAINASLNGSAAVLLVAGYVLIKLRREQAHILTMLAAFVVSILFLACYLVYHAALVQHTGEAGRKFGGEGTIRTVYFAILISHVVLAALVPFLAVGTIYLGVKDRRRAHSKLAWWTFPIWLYVSITGVVIYAMLYHLYPLAA